MNRRYFLKNSVIAGAALGLGFHHPGKVSVKNRFETIIANGLVYAGDGKAPVKADVGISEGKIAAIGQLGNSCDRLVDAANKVVSPGFIDIHTHTDTNFYSCPFGDSRIY
jgi:N-acyl-D-aspartate/D-glutamate deacylase